MAKRVSDMEARARRETKTRWHGNKAGTRIVLRPITLEVRSYEDGEHIARAAFCGEEGFHRTVDTPCRPAIALGRMLRDALDDDDLEALRESLR